MKPANLPQVQNGAAPDLWASLLRHQVSLSLPVELPFFFSCPAWRRAKRVMDIGTGTGEHLIAISRYFPEKVYTGIDISADLIDRATQRAEQEQQAGRLSIQFALGDAYTHTSRTLADVVVARLLIQHLKDLDRFLINTSQLLAPGGALIVIESDDSVRYFEPDLPLLGNLFAELKIAQRRIDGERDAARIMKEKAAVHGFQLKQDQHVVIPSSLPGNKDLFRESYRGVFRVVRDHYGLDLDYGALEEELQEWYTEPMSYAQIGVNLSCYQMEPIHLNTLIT